MKSLLASIMLCISCTAYSQKNIPAFGNIDKADLEMKEYNSDKTAEAVVLFDVAEVYCSLNLNSIVNDYLHTEFNRHVRIKILREKGLDNANIRIPYYSDKNAEEIKNISAQTYNLDASGNIVITKLEKDLVYRKKIDKRRSEVVFTFPGAKSGSIIEFKYRDEATDLYGLKSWYFQGSTPVMLSRYILNFPMELIVTATAMGSLRVTMKETLKEGRNIKTFTMLDVPSLKNEAYISCKEDYLEKVEPLLVGLELPGIPYRNLLRTWPGIVHQLIEDDDFGVQLKKNIPRTSELDAMLINITAPYNKMVVIHDYVRKNMQWNEQGGIWALEGVKSAWKNKKGTTGEINLILVNLLRDAGLDAHPVLVSTRENGRINTAVAGFDQFNKVMAYVQIDDKDYVMDASDRNTPAKLIPYEVSYSEGLVIGKIENGGWGWKTLWDKKQCFKDLVIVQAAIDVDGIMKGQAVVSSDEYSRLSRMKNLREGKDKFIKVLITDRNPDLHIESLDYKNEETDSLPLVQNYKFNIKTNASGDYHYFSANLFSDFDKNPFIADNRVSDVYFGANQKYTITGNFTIPENYKFDELPKNIKLIMPDTSIIFTRYVSATESVASIRIVAEFNKPFYTTEEYINLQEFYKKMFDLLNEQFVYRKK